MNFAGYCDGGKFSDSFKMVSFIFNGSVGYNHIYDVMFTQKYHSGDEINHRLSQTYEELKKVKMVLKDLNLAIS